ncbi:MAG: phosphatidylglycerophosphatase A [Gallicola sp.]|uniref:phosphatidylglycerophosphatase A family protein n=1 Tax=Gallicola sp. Sow4_E12 TaxID=3438785 RepID=UPI00181E945E|nr:phosphatidylglycerophosphatase A [Gallicola sp.]
MGDNQKRQYRYTMEELTKFAIEALKRRNIGLDDLAKIVHSLQVDYHPDLDLETCRESIRSVMRKREVVHAILTGIALDELAEQNLLKEPLLSIVKSDEGLFGIDEIIPLSIVNIYGSIGLTNYGYLDKKKYGIIKELDEAKDDSVNTFLDDIVAALAAAASSRIAHSYVE